MGEENSILDNIEIHKDFAIISVNPKLYTLSDIYSAAYWLLDRTHIIIDGDPETEILIEIRPKRKEDNIDLKEIGYEFNDELINYSVYTVQSTRNKRLREMIVENALSGNLRNNSINNQQNSFQNGIQQIRSNQQEQCGCDENNDSIINQNLEPGKQGLRQEEIKKIKELSKPKQREIFSGPIKEDNEGISNIIDYRHKSEEF